MTMSPKIAISDSVNEIATIRIELLEALADPDHPNHVDASEWADDYDPDVIDELPIKYALARIANRRNALAGGLPDDLDSSRRVHG